MKAHLKQFRVSPKKANLVASMVRGKNVVEAVELLKFTPKKTAPVLKKLIESAIANAENNFKQNKETLKIKEITVNEGPTYKRRVCISKGRAHPILKRTSHITVKLESDNKTVEKKEDEPKVKEVKNEVKEIESKKETKEDKK